MAHHLFSCWHGDYRLRRKYGEVCDCCIFSPLMSIITCCIRHWLKGSTCAIAASVHC